LAPLVLATFSVELVVFTLLPNLVAVILCRWIPVRQVALQDRLSTPLATAHIGLPKDTTPLPALAVLEIATLCHALLSGRTVTLLYCDIAHRIAAVTLCKISLHYLAIRHGTREFHTSLKKEQALVVHCLCDKGAVGARVLTEADSVRLPKKTLSVLYAPVPQLLAS